MATPVKMQRLSKVATEGEILEWLKSPGDPIQEGEPLLKVLSEKATIEMESPATGILLDIVVPAGAQESVGAVLAWIGQPGETIEGTEPEASAEQPTESTNAPPTHFEAPSIAKSAGKPQGKVKASPVARRMAREHGIALESLAGTGPGGSITKSDVERVVQASRAAVAEKVAGPVPLPDLEPGTRMEPLSGIQRIMMNRMSLSRDNVAQATTIAEVDMTEIAEIRETVPATFTAWVILATVRALGEYPILNASLYGDQIAYHPGVHMGVSVETDAGLMVPVVHNAHKIGLSQIHDELSRLVKLAREGTLTPNDVEGATFTVTNSGVLGSVLYTPMIVPPQGAILGMGRVARTPVVRDEQIVIRSMMYHSLSYDHRFIAGGTAVRYLQRVRQYLENPASLVWG